MSETISISRSREQEKILLQPKSLNTIKIAASTKYSISFGIIIIEGVKKKDDFSELNLTLDDWKKNPKTIFFKGFRSDEWKQLDLKANETSTISEIHKIKYFGKQSNFTLFSVRSNNKGEFFLLKNVKWKQGIKSEKGCMFIYEPDIEDPNVVVNWESSKTDNDDKKISVKREIIVKFKQSMPQIYYDSPKKNNLKRNGLSIQFNFLKIYPLPVIKENPKLDFIVNIFDIDIYNDIQNSPQPFIEDQMEQINTLFYTKFIIRNKNQDIPISSNFNEWQTLPLNENEEVTSLIIEPVFGESITTKFELITEEKLNLNFEDIETGQSININKPNIMFCPNHFIDKIKQNENWFILEHKGFVNNLNSIGDFQPESIYIQTHGYDGSIVDEFITLNEGKNADLKINGEAIEKHIASDYSCTLFDDYIMYREINALLKLIEKVKPKGNFIFGGCKAANEDPEQLIKKLFDLSNKEINIYANLDSTNVQGAEITKGDEKEYEKLLDYPISDGDEFKKGWMVIGSITNKKLIKLSDFNKNTGQIILKAKGTAVYPTFRTSKL
ncbi:MAG: hypothetical protein JXR70_04840 [Spirochaetales bacterium]|nr:hypothetical protein [Spirochaetales bacterium]